MEKCKNIALMGGGVLGIAYAGALEVLEQNDYLETIENVAGTSVGAIGATLLSLKYSADDIKHILHETNFKSFHDGLNPLNLTNKYGIYKGDALLKWIKEFIKRKTNNAESTFKDFEELGYINLKIFATDLSVPELVEFSANKTPNVVVAESLRASIAIPLYFTGWKFSSNIPNDHIYVDGGVMYNFPITAFENIDETIGLYLDIQEKSKILDYNDISLYVKQLFRAVLLGQNIDFYKFYNSENQIIKIDSLEIPFTKFDLSKNEKKKLFDEGKKAAQEFINRKK